MTEWSALHSQVAPPAHRRPCVCVCVHHVRPCVYQRQLGVASSDWHSVHKTYLHGHGEDGRMHRSRLALQRVDQALAQFVQHGHRVLWLRRRHAVVGAGGTSSAAAASDVAAAADAAATDSVAAAAAAILQLLLRRTWTMRAGRRGDGGQRACNCDGRMRK